MNLSESQPVLYTPSLTASELCSIITDEGNCIISHAELRYWTPVTIQWDKGALIFNETEIVCKPRFAESVFPYCHVRIEVTGEHRLIMIDTTIYASGFVSQVSQGYTEINNGTVITTSGTITTGYGISSTHVIAGSHAGQGGFCQNDGRFSKGDEELEDKTYGSTYRQPDYLEFDRDIAGSPAYSHDPASAGGGMIMIESHTANIDGKLYANGAPLLKYDAEVIQRVLKLSSPPQMASTDGGSGGYVYIQINNKTHKPVMGINGQIQVKGGEGYDEYYGGGGGRILLNNIDNDAKYFDASGGSSTHKKICARGAAGIIYNMKCDEILIKTNYTGSKEASTKGLRRITPIEVKPQHRGTSNFTSKIIVEGLGTIAARHDSSLPQQNSMHYKCLLMMKYSQLTVPIQYQNTPYTDFFLNGNNIEFTNASSIYFHKARVVKIRAEVFTTSPFFMMEFQQKVQFNVGRGIIGGSIFSRITNTSGSVITKVKMFATELLQILPGTIEADYIYIQCDKIIQIEGDLNSPLALCKGEFRSEIEGMKPNFQCLKRSGADEKLSWNIMSQNYKSFIGMSNETELTNQTFSDLIHSNYTIYIYSNDRIQTSEDAVIQGGRIGVCGKRLKLEGIINTNYMGCKASKGIGALDGDEKCAGVGASYGGVGGQGMNTSFVDTKDTTCVKKFREPYGSDKEVFLEGSGGGGYPGLSYGGSGGGVVSINVLTNITVDGKVSAKGQSGLVNKYNASHGFGGGSGGSIQLLCQVLKGKNSGVFDIRGGAGSGVNGGGGSGGRLVVTFTKSTLVEMYPTMTAEWNGTFYNQGGRGAKEGRQGQSGTLWSTRCQSGFSGFLCHPCKAGTFKLDYSYSQCEICTNKPQNSFYVGQAEKSDQCPYQCVKDYSPSSVNPACLAPFDLFINNIGGIPVVIVIILSSITLIIAVTCFFINKQKTNFYFDADFEANLNTELLNKLDDKTKKQILERLSLSNIDLPFHMARVYFVGQNMRNNNWVIPKTAPAEVRPYISDSKYAKFAKLYSRTSQWTENETFFHTVFQILYPPLALYFYYKKQNKYYQRMRAQFTTELKEVFWKSIEEQIIPQRTKSIKFSCSEDMSLGYIDFIDLTRARDDYIGPKLPITFMISGDGSFDFPYQINMRDPLFQSILKHFPEQGHRTEKKLGTIIENFNSYLTRLSFYDFTPITLKRLSVVLKFLQLANDKFFKPNMLQVMLYIFDTPLKKKQNYGKEYKKSFPLDYKLIQKYQIILKQLLKSITKTNHDIKLGIRIRTYIPRQSEFNGESTKATQAIANSGANEERQEFLHYFTPSVVEPQHEDSDSSEEESKPYEELRESLLNEEAKMSNLIESVKSTDPSYIHQPIVHEQQQQNNDWEEEHLFNNKSTETGKLDKCRFFIVALARLIFFDHQKPSRYPKVSLIVYVVFILIDLLIVVNLTIHMQRFDEGEEAFYKFGIFYFFFYPLCSLIAPLIGLLNVCTCSTKFIYAYIYTNALSCMSNLLSAIVLQIIFVDFWYYIMLSGLLIGIRIVNNKLAFQQIAHFKNPLFYHNDAKISKMGPQNGNDEGMLMGQYDDEDEDTPVTLTK